MTAREKNIEYICSKTSLNKDDKLVPIILRMLSETYIEGLRQGHFDIQMDLILNDKMDVEEKNVFNTNNWDKCIEIIRKYWNTDYGTANLNDNMLELTTGGWSENEEIIDIISNTMFWFLWWQESKRGGYYKFIYTEKVGG